MPTHYPGSAAERAALDAYIKLTRAAESVFDRTTRHLQQHRLTPSQFAMLEALYYLGTLAQVELARKVLKSTGNVTVVLQHLEKRGLIARERDANDQRYVRVSITEAGRTLVERVMPEHVRGIVADFAVLTPHEQDMLATLCRSLGLQQRSGQPGDEPNAAG